MSLVHTLRNDLPKLMTDCIRRLRTTGPHTDDPVRLRVFSVDDPDGNIRLMAASGSVDAGTVTGLTDELERVGAGQQLHLDLHRAVIDSVATLRRLESQLDRLELRGVRLRIVGVDPDHPVLAASGW